MFDMKDKKDYRVRLKKARKRRRGKDYERYLLPGALVLAGVILVGAVGIGIRNYISTGVGKATLSQTERLAIEASTSEALAASKAKAEEERIDSECVMAATRPVCTENKISSAQSHSAGW